MNLQNLQDFLTNPIITVFSTICSLIITYRTYRFTVQTYWHPIREKQKDRNLLNKNLGQGPFDKDTIKWSTEYYIYPKFSNLDPTQEKEIRHALTKATGDLFKEVNRFLDEDIGYRHLLILGDSGTGKTSCILNYYAYNIRKRKKAHKISLIHLGCKEADNWIAKIPDTDRKERVIFLDALDEDINAIQNHRQRIRDLMDICQDFKRVIITCRTQFFSKDEEIPVKTGIIRIEPRQLGEKGAYEFRKLYLAPFDDEDVTRYVKQRYHLWAYTHRRKAFELVDKIPQLNVRPMLLAYIPDIIKRGVEVKTIYQLYEVIVEAWFDRESFLVENKEALWAFSEQLAVDLFVNRMKRGQEQVTKEELLQLAREWEIPLESWKLRGRSLLNRDAVGNYKFAHRSIMEFLFVKQWLNGNKKARQVALTDQMNKFLNETDLNGVDLSKTNLSKADFRGADLSRVDLSEANLFEADLRRANLFEANLSEVNLRKTDLRWTDLRGTNLRRTNLQKTKIDNTTQIDPKWRLVWEIINHKVKNRNFIKADLSWANLSGADLRGMNLGKADLSGTDLRKADLRRTDLRRADLRRTNLQKTKIDNTTQIDPKWRLVWEIINHKAENRNFIKADLSGEDLRGLDLSWADLRRADLGRANLRKANLRKADLSGANLRKANLSGTDLRGADLRRINLQKTKIDNTTQIDPKWRLIWEIINHKVKNRNFIKADLSWANLSGADLRGMNLGRANLRKANLSKADLSGANLRKANLSGTDLRGADLRRTNLQKTKIDNTTQIDPKWRLVWEIINHKAENRDLIKADQKRANLGWAEFSEEVFSEEVFSKEDFSEEEFSGTDLSGMDPNKVSPSMTDLHGKNVIDVNLNKMRLSEAHLIEIYLSKTTLIKADLSGADLSGANFSKANLSWVYFSGANLSGADLSKTDLTRMDFRWADLSDADLSKALLRETNFSGANLSGTDLSGANLSGANLSGTDLSGANLSGTDLKETIYDNTTKMPKRLTSLVHEIIEQ